MHTHKRWRYRQTALVVDEAKDPTPVVLFLGTFLYLAAVASRVEPLRIPAAMLFVAASAAVAVLFLTATAFVTVAVRDTGFGELRHAVVKFAAIYLLSAGAGAWTGGWVGGGVDCGLCLLLTMWLFDVDWVDAGAMMLANLLLYIAVLGSAAALLSR